MAYPLLDEAAKVRNEKVSGEVPAGSDDRPPSPIAGRDGEPSWSPRLRAPSAPVFTFKPTLLSELRDGAEIEQIELSDGERQILSRLDRLSARVKAIESRLER